MSTERKMIGLSAQAHSVPQVPIDYGTRGTPSLLSRPQKEPIKSKTNMAGSRFVIKNQYCAESRLHSIQMRIPGLETDCFHHTQNKLNSKIAGFKAKHLASTMLSFLAPCFLRSEIKHAGRAISNQIR